MADYGKWSLSHPSSRITYWAVGNPVPTLSQLDASGFLVLFGQERAPAGHCIAHLVCRLAALPDFGCHLGYNGKAIEIHSTGRGSRSAVRDRGGCRRAASASGCYGRPSGDAGCRHSSILLRVVVWRGKRRSSGRFIKRCWSA
ncbi:MAG: hypothetical protein EOM22_11930 [Gammaproteobacteria bacterium]|nr:hypothetical protein [Gammaproteobacteria bacterium]